jgi:hypothetical protein
LLLVQCSGRENDWRGQAKKRSQELYRPAPPWLTRKAPLRPDVCSHTRPVSSVWDEVWAVATAVIAGSETPQAWE